MKAEISHGLLLEEVSFRGFLLCQLKSPGWTRKGPVLTEAFNSFELAAVQAGAPPCVKALSFAEEQHALTLTFVAAGLRIFRVS